MSIKSKTMLKFLGQLLFIQAVFSQCIRREPSCGFGPSGISAFDNLRGPFNPLNIPVPNQPMGISVSADNLIIDGFLDVTGNLPLLASVVVDSTVPSNGQVRTAFGCGDGNVGITNAGMSQPMMMPMPGPGLGPLSMAPNFSLGAMNGMNMNKPPGCGFM